MGSLGRGAATGIEFHFFCAKIKVCLRFTAGSSSPPDCCIFMGSIPASFYIIKQRHPFGWRCLIGAGNRDRTGTLFTARDFKSLVSACSTIPAGKFTN